MKNLFFTLIALISGFASAQHIEGIKTISIIPAASGLNMVIYGMPNNGFLAESYVVDPSLFKPAVVSNTLLEIGKIYRFNIEDGVIVDFELVSGPLKEDGTFKMLPSRFIIESNPEGQWYEFDTWQYSHWIDESVNGRTFLVNYYDVDFENNQVTLDGTTYNFAISENGLMLSLLEVGKDNAILLIRIG